MIKVMLIDDEPEIRRLLHKMVEKQDGYQVVSERGDFAGAVADFARYRPDVVFVDIDLNGEDGLSCARVLTELDPKLKVIFATAHSEYMANAFEIYAFDYLVKPFNMERLVRTLNRIRSSMTVSATQREVQYAAPAQTDSADSSYTQQEAMSRTGAADSSINQNTAASGADAADSRINQNTTASGADAADSHINQNTAASGAGAADSLINQNTAASGTDAVDSRINQNTAASGTGDADSRAVQRRTPSDTNAANHCSLPEKVGSSDKISRPDRYRGKLLIKGKDHTCLLDVEDILFIERMDGSTNIVTVSGEQFKTSASLSDLEAKLDSESFMRCHKSYIVNLSRITRIEPYGRWTYVAKFRNCELSALMTAQKYEEMKKLFS